jgi:hypothetical protein
VLRANDWEANNLDSVYETRDGKSNPGGYDAVNRYGDEFYFANDYTQLVAFYPGLNRFYRTGYLETDLVDYNTRNYKANAAFEYKLDERTRIIFASNFGSGTTVYQGDNRYSLKNILFFQNRLELNKAGKYFIRAYATNESAGDSYDAYFTALLLQKKAKSDINWGSTDYANYWATQVVPQIQNLEGYPQFTGDYLQYIADIKAFLQTVQPDLFAYHQSAADYANNESLSPGENAYFEPGTYEFDTAFNSIISKESYSQGGSKLYDKSALYNVHGEYKFTPKIMDITVGANYRMYRPNSNGTIFSDTNGVKITNWEYGVYGGLEKWLIKDQLKLNATCRMDKNVNFDYLFSPAASAVYLFKKHVFRLSFSSAIRNPTLTDQYLFYNVGRARLVGNINGFDSLVTVPSLLNFFNYANPDTFSYFNVEPVRPEQVKTIEVGYRASLFKHVFVDMSYYYSWYKYFIGYKLGADIDYNSIVNRVNDFVVYRVAANSIDQVTTQGFSIGINYYIKQNYTINGNYTFNKLDRHDSTDPLIPAFNTPQNKYNIGFSGRDLQFPQISLYNFGFSINYRWVEGFIYEGSPQFTGFVPTYGKLDVQVNKQFPKISMNLKIGASNILNNLKYEVYGGPYVGRLAYVNAVFDFGKK